MVFLLLLIGNGVTLKSHAQLPEYIQHCLDSVQLMEPDAAFRLLHETRKQFSDSRYEVMIDSAVIAQVERWERAMVEPKSQYYLHQKAAVYLRQNQLGTVIEISMDGLRMPNTSGDDSLSHFVHLWRSYAKIGDTHRAFAWYDKFLDQLRRLDRLWPNFHEEDDFHVIYGMLGLDERALYYARRRREREFLRDPASTQSASSLNNFGVMFMRAAQYDSALVYFDKAHAAMIRQIEAENLVPEDQMYQFQYFIKGNIGDVYLETQEFEKALPLLLDDLNRSQSAYRPSDRANVSLGIARAYLGLNRPVEALPYLDVANDYFQPQNQMDRLVQIGRLRSEFYYQTRNWTQYRYWNQYVAHLQDSIQNATRISQLDALMVSRELDAKDAQLVKQQSKMQADAVSLQAIKTERNFTVILALLIAVLLGAGIWWAIRERRQKAIMEQAAKEKEVLLSEIHHRVKNNLQIVTGLLQIQGGTLEDPKAVQALMEAEQRVRAMAMIGDKLYAKNISSEVDFQPYLEELVNSIAISYAKPGKEIEVHVECAPVRLSLDTSVPLGLVVNELVSNACKHAFEGRSQGRIDVRFKTMQEQQFRLEVKDDGVGVQKDLDNLSEKHIGVSLIRGLAKQLKGNMDVVSTPHGTQFAVQFKGSAAKSVTA